MHFIILVMTVFMVAVVWQYRFDIFLSNGTIYSIDFELNTFLPPRPRTLENMHKCQKVVTSNSVLQATSCSLFVKRAGSIFLIKYFLC